MRITQKVDEVKESIRSYIKLVEAMLVQATEGAKSQSWEDVREVIDVMEPKANDLKLEIANQCLGVLALFHPEASHLRYVVKMSGMASDLERMGDMATKIARACFYWKDVFSINDHPIILEMIEEDHRMLSDVAAAFINEDSLAAVAVIQHDDIVDELCTRNLKKLMKQMYDSKEIEPLIQVMNITRNLERLADLCGHMAEDIIFIKEGMFPPKPL